MSTRQSAERRELEYERRTAQRERTMTRRLGRCAKHATVDTRVTHSAHIKTTVA